ncbi:MAG: HlyD family efflux transporter periplasmic adaptor subunit [Caldilineaceae bacterium]|nr:HlyD family efflux transporter periplasmic adaptor subunit [Caldilineaceae bacterium]
MLNFAKLRNALLGSGVLLLFVVGCAQQPTPTPTPAATPLPPVGMAAGGTTRAAGKVVPVGATNLSFAVSGRVQNLAVAEGDQVEAGTLLIALENAAASASVAQAQAALLRVQAQLDELHAGPRAQEIAVAQALLEVAQAHLAQLSEEARPGDLAAAQAELDAAQARFDALYSEPDDVAVTAAWASVQQAQAALDRLLHPATASEVAAAEAQVQSAQAEVDLLKAGARDEEIAAAEAAVAEAQATLTHAEADLAMSQLLAPFAGTVTAIEVNSGEMVQVGQVVLTIADLSHMQVETTDLSERDVVRVAAGQPVVVFVKALNRETPGRVARVSPQATVIGGDVVYTVVIDLDEQPPDLRWGMSVEVEIQD